MKSGLITLTLERWDSAENGYIEQEYDVHYTYYPAERGIRDSWGAPLEPDYPESFDIDEVRTTDKKPYVDIVQDLTEAEITYILTKLMED